ncbi:MAG: transcriptional regulator [Planctomycetota bacterium]
MLRKDLIELLRNNSMGLVEIAGHLEVSPKDVEDDLRHLIKSLKHSDCFLVVTPAYCRKCDFTFNKDKLHKPGKCPQCNSTWIQGPLFDIEQKTI